MPTAEDRLRAALAYVDPKIADADERYYTALHKAGVLKAPWSVTKAHGGIRGLPDAQRQLVIRLASGKVGSFTPTLAEKVGAVPLQAGAKVLSMGLEGLADINKPILELDPLQKSWQWVKAQLEALPRALVVRAVSARQGKPMGQIAHEWQVLKNTVAHFSENPELDQLLRQKGVSYKDALLQGGADPRIAAYGGFLLDALMPDKVTSAAGVIGRSAMAVKGARRQAALRQVEALETARRAERLADRTAREGKVLEQIGAEGVRALPEKAPARRLSEAVAQTAKADRAAAQLARVQAKGFPTVEAFKAAQAEKWAKAAAEKARLQAQLQARAEIEFAQSLAGQRKAMQAGAKALQQKELDQYLESQPRREFPGQPKVQVPGGRAELPPVSSPRPQPAAELEAMPQYIQQLGGPKEIDRKLAAFRQAEAERGAKAAADKEAAKAAKGTKAPRAPKRPAEPKPKLAPTIPYKQTDIDKTLDSYRRVGVPENYLKQVEDQLYAGTGQAFIDQARKWRAQWAKEAGQAKKQARLQEESLERPIDEAAALADPFDAERLDSLAQAPARAPAEPARPKSEPLAQSSPRFTATDMKETPTVIALRRQQDDLETALWRLTKVPRSRRYAPGGWVAKSPEEQALLDKLAAVNRDLEDALTAPAPPTKTEAITEMIREGVPERGPGWETESLEGGRGPLGNERGAVLLPKEAQAQVQRIGEALGSLKGKDFDALLAKITRLQRIGKLYASPQGAWRDILGTALTHAAIFESDPLAWMSAAIDLKLDDLAKSKRGWALDTFLDSAADVWPVAGPQGLMRGLESGGKADAAAIPLPKPLDRGRALRQGVNRFWEKMGLVEALKRMALTGTPQDVALAQKLLKGDELPLSHAVRPITRPVRLADFSPEAQKALHWGVTATSGDPFQTPAWLKTLSNRGIGPLFHTWAVQVPMHRGQALLKAASEWNPGPAWQTYKEGRAYANFAGPPAVNEEGQPVRGPLYPPPPGKTQYQQKGMDFMIDPFRYGVAYDLKGSPTARMSVAGIAGEGPQQAAGNLPGPYLEKAKHLIGGSLSGLSALVQPGIWPQLLYRGTQILKGDENPVQPGVDAGLIAPEAAAKLSASLRSAGVANPNTPGAKAGRLLLELGKQFAPSEVTQALKLPQLAPTLGLGRKSPSGLPSQEGMDYLIYLLGGASKPASRYDLSIGPYLQMLENRRGLKGANR